jgi:ADP-ribose pyrophosphatase YjhB (NUDIX family)
MTDRRPAPARIDADVAAVVDPGVAVIDPNLDHVADREADPVAGLRIRRAARAVLIDPNDRILLVRFEFPNATRWALPGGGLETGETGEDALRRELAEEVGLVDAAIGPHVWTRLHIIPFIGGQFDGQVEEIHLVRAAGSEPRPQLTWAQLNAEYVYELRWWTLAEIAASDAHFVPAALAQHLAALLRDGAPPAPIDVGV